MFFFRRVCVFEMIFSVQQINYRIKTTNNVEINWCMVGLFWFVKGFTFKYLKNVSKLKTLKKKEFL